MKLILALYPNSRGLGFVCVELPQKLTDAGVITVRPICNGIILTRIEKFMDFFKPEIVVVRNAEALAPTANRIKKLINAITELAIERGIAVHQYTREQIRDVFEVWGSSTKYQIAHKIIEWFPELANRAPKIRKAWMEEDYNMGLFDALSLAITHAYVTE